MSAAADSGPLIAPAKLGRVTLLPPLYSETLVPSPVYEEAVLRGAAGGHADARD